MKTVTCSRNLRKAEILTLSRDLFVTDLVAVKKCGHCKLLLTENGSISNESAVIHKYPDGMYLSVAAGDLSNHLF